MAEHLLLLSFLYWAAFAPSQAAVKRYQFDVVVKNVSRLCHSKPIVSVNGKFPGPTIHVHEGDRLVINVTNRAHHNISIHWHGLKQFRNGWADGPAYITQCPITPGRSYAYDFTVVGQRGTLWWHAHIAWLRATVHGAFVVLPKKGDTYPFPSPDKEANIILGEWWHADIESVEEQGNKLGMPSNLSDAHTINGKPGPLFPCSEKNTYALEVEAGKTYLLRIINAALSDELFFAVAGHNLTVVEIDAVYCKPFTTSTVLIAPGQTTNVILEAEALPGRYFMAARVFHDVANIPVDENVAVGIVQYSGISPSLVPSMAVLPAINATSFAAGYRRKLRSLNSDRYPARVPLSVDRRLFYVASLGKNPCSDCVNKTRFTASLNNISFVMPRIGLLQAHYWKMKGVFSADFPDTPPKAFDYTGGLQMGSLSTTMGTRVSRLEFNSSVELVLQDTSLVSVDSHPFHLHGHNFFVVGQGIGNFDPVKDRASFNLVDPPERNTVGVPTGGWAAVRFRADNPGVWFMHCHIEQHTTWGLKMAFLVENGSGPEQSILPPPNDLPSC